MPTTTLTESSAAVAGDQKVRLPNPSELYQSAIADKANGGYGNARVTLPSGDEIICSVRKVAGRSQVHGHFRTTWHIVHSGEKFSKPISHVDVRAALRDARVTAPTQSKTTVED